ncbi:MAG: hypothetical protein ACRD01_11845 [Terriglobales bacterium]
MSAIEAAAAVRDFLLAHARTEVWEQGQRLTQLGGERSGYSLSSDAGRLVCHFWSENANLVRRVVGLGPAGPERLRLHCLRMGQTRPSTLILQGVGAGTDPVRMSRRTEFRQQLLAAAQREWPGWRPEPLPARSIMGGAARHPVQCLLLRRRHELLLCAAAEEQESAEAAESTLAHALVWASQLRSHWPARVLKGVNLVLPKAALAVTQQRLAWLRRSPPTACWELDRSSGELNQVRLEENAMVASELRRAQPVSDPAASSKATAALLAEVREHCPQAAAEWTAEGTARISVYGLPVAWEAPATGASAWSFGCREERTPLTADTRPLFENLLRQLASSRLPGGGHHQPLYTLQAEGWMEYLLRRDIRLLDAHLDPRWIYAQVPVCGPGQREVMDLLAVDRGGVLHVIELKGGEDMGFPLQALDYWLRVRYHQQQGDFERLGYFPGVSISAQPPRLWLVAPALRWHPSTDLLGRWLSPEVPWLRLGVNEEWRHGLQIIFRKEAHH